MDSSIIHFAINGVLPWLVFSGLVYVITSYLTKNDNTSPGVWWSALIFSFIPFIPFSVGTIDIVLPELDYIDSNLENVQIVKQAGITQASLMSLDWIAIALIIGYVGMTCVKLFRLVSVWQKLKRLSASSESITEWSSGKAKVVLSPLNHSPFAFGVTAPHVVLPQYFSQLNKAQQSILVQHELTHIKEKDTLTILLWRLLNTLLWINPFVKKMEGQFLRAIEHRCDRLTVRRFNINKLEYAKTLIESLKRSAQPDSTHLVAPFNSSLLCAKDYKTRISNIVGATDKNSLSLILKFSLGILTLISMHMFLKALSANDKVTWQEPLNEHWISSTFGSVNNLRYYKPLQGVDYVARKGSSVLSAADGIVVVADNKTLHSNYGNTVLIQHKAGYQTLYSHLASIDAQVGAWVKAGQPIGIIGETGRATGVHLHFQIIKDNQRIDPHSIFGSQALM